MISLLVFFFVFFFNVYVIREKVYKLNYKASTVGSVD